MSAQTVGQFLPATAGGGPLFVGSWVETGTAWTSGATRVSIAIGQLFR